MSRTQRALVSAVTRALKNDDIDFERDDDHPDDVVGFDFVLGTKPAYSVRVLVVDERIVVVYLHPGFQIPPERGADVFAWSCEQNNEIYLGTVEFDAPNGLILFRHSIECVDIPPAALVDVLCATWHRAYTGWLEIAPSLIPVLAGQAYADEGEEEDEDDAPSSVEAGEGDDVSEDEEEWTEEDEEEYVGNVQGISDALHAALEERFGADLADHMDGTLWNLADNYMQTLGESGPLDTGVTARAVGSEERALLVLSAAGAPSLRFRFSATAVTEQMSRDRAGMTLLHAASEEDARRILADGFTDAAILQPGNYTIERDGLRREDGDPDEDQGILLTDKPLPHDDRVGRPAQLVIRWGEDAPSIIEHEALATGYSGTEAWLIVPPLRRWHVPAQVLNEAISDGLATVSIG